MAEIPPGPPVLSTLVAEVYGPDTTRQIEIARQIRDIFEKTPGVVDVDWYVEADQKKLIFEVNRTRRPKTASSTEALSQSMRIALSGAVAGLVHLREGKGARGDLPSHAPGGAGRTCSTLRWPSTSPSRREARCLWPSW